MKIRMASLTAAAALALGVTQAPAAHAAAPVVQAQAPTAQAAAVAKPRNRVGWAYVNSKTPNKGYVFKKSALPVGKKGKAVYRSYLRMSLVPAVNATKVTSVKLRVPVLTPNPCLKGKNFAVQVFITSPLTTRITWKKQPKGKRWQWLKVKCKGKVLEVNVTRAAVNILNKGGESISFGLRADTEKNSRKYMTFSNAAQLIIKASFDDGDPGTGPDPSTTKPNAVTGANFAGQACVVGEARPKITVANGTFGGTVSDKDGGFVFLRAEWRKKGSVTATTADSPQRFTTSGEKVALQAVATGFETGIYEWRVQGHDDVAGGAWTGWCEFEVALPVAAAPPGIPTGLKLTVNGVDYPCATGLARPTFPAGSTGTASAKVTDANGDATTATFSFATPDDGPWVTVAVQKTAASADTAKTITVPARPFEPGLYRWYVFGTDNDGQGEASDACEYSVSA